MNGISTLIQGTLEGELPHPFACEDTERRQPPVTKEVDAESAGGLTLDFQPPEL